MPTHKSWRDKAREVIHAVQKANPDATPEEMQKLLFAAYPFGNRTHHPYRIWCDEVNKTKKQPTPKEVINFWIK
jgi:urease accessory protein UreE